MTLVGRAEELDRLSSVLGRLGQDGVPGVVDIAGDAGMGKSRLLSEVCARARRLGLAVIRGRATEYERHNPFQALTDAFADVDRAFLDSGAVPDAAAPVLRGVDGAQGTGTRDRFGLYRAVAEVLTGLGERGGLVVALDDLHWADPASLELLDHLIRHPASGRVLLLVARRRRQTPPSLAAALTRGVDTGAVLPMVLRPLPERDSIEALAPDLPPADAKQIYASSEGNPLYLRSLLHAYRRGASSPGTTARGHDATASGVSSGLASLLLDELSALTEAQRHALEAVAVLGDHTTPAMLTLTVPHITAEELDDCLDALARRDLLRMGSDGRWTLRHPLLRALVYENTAAARRPSIHRGAADALTRAGASAAERAHHVERSLHDWDPAAAAVLTEAAAHFAHTAPATAAHLLDVVLRLMPSTPVYAQHRGELTLARARALAVGGSLRDSRDLLHTLISASGQDHTSLRGDAIALYAALERHLGHSPEATALLQRELAGNPPPGPRQVVSLGLALGMAALNTVSYPDVRHVIEQTLAVARSHGDLTGELGALGEAYEGETAAARVFADAAAAIADSLTGPNLTELGEALVWLAWAEALLERYADAERHAGRGLDIARRGGQVHVLPHLLSSKAFVHLNTSELSAALESAEEAESVARAIGSSDLLAFTLCFKALILLVHCPLGDTGALETAEEAVATAGRSSHWWASLARCMLGHTALVNGDPHRAQESILKAGGPGLRRLQPSIRPGQLDTLVSTALATGDSEQAARWAALAVEEADRMGLSGQHGAALRAEATLAQHHGANRAAADLFARAAQAYVTTGATLWEAYSLLLASSQAQAAGDGPRALVMWERARRIADQGGARLLSDLAALVRPQPEELPPTPTELDQLTTREREIAELVAEGLSNQAIATKLYLSRRTVETHLSAIYRKTSVPSRSALAGLMTRVALDRRATD